MVANAKPGISKGSTTSLGENARDLQNSTLSPDGGYRRMIGNRNITKFPQIEIPECSLYWSLPRTIQTAPRFCLIYGLRPPPRTNLGTPLWGDMITLATHLSWARKSAGGMALHVITKDKR